MASVLSTIINLFTEHSGPLVRKLRYTSKKNGGQLPGNLVMAIHSFCLMLPYGLFPEDEPPF
ncbi:MAG TPA: hypothetical protein DCR87_08935 [Acidobacteria bacterium]|nr:hypothetical protein [Acidobacteriota bacterium]